MDIYIPKKFIGVRRRPRHVVQLKVRRGGVFVRLIALLLIISMNTVGFAGVGHTAALFNDSEVSPNNPFRAGLVDFSLANHSFVPEQTALNLEPGTSTAKYIEVFKNPDTNPFQYFASSSHFELDLPFCADLQSTAAVAGMFGTTTLYQGPLLGLVSATTTEIAPWYLSVSLPATSTAINAVCSFDTDFNGWQTRHDIPTYGIGGFSDTETVSHVVYSSGLRLNKVYYDVDESKQLTIQKCEPRSPGYWSNNEGCTNGAGSSHWEPQLNTFSSGFSGTFATATGSQICQATVPTNCPASNTNPGRQCKARRHLVAVELSAVSGKLDLDAIIAGTDNGDGAFDRLLLSGTSTIREAIIVAESIISRATSTAQEYNDAGKVMERLYTYYENQNPVAPFCSYDVTEDPGRGVEGENEWVELYNQTPVPIDIAGWSVCDGASCDVLPAGGTTTIPAHGFAVITGTTTTWQYWRVQKDIVKVIVPDGRIGDGLHDDADMLLLKRPDGVTLDYMNYGEPDLSWQHAHDGLWHPGVPDVPEGHLIGRRPNGFDTNQPTDWAHFAPPLVTLIYPNPNDNSQWWYWGNTYDITWDATNQNGPDSDLLIDLFYVEDLDNSASISTPDKILTIATSTENDGHHLFEIPSGFLGWVWVKLVAQGPENPLMNTVVTSGRIWDPMPVPLNELWGEEQSDIPEEEEHIVEELLSVDELPLELASSTQTGAPPIETSVATTSDEQRGFPVQDEAASSTPVYGGSSGTHVPADEVVTEDSVASSTAATDDDLLDDTVSYDDEIDTGVSATTTEPMTEHDVGSVETATTTESLVIEESGTLVEQVVASTTPIEVEPSNVESVPAPDETETVTVLPVEIALPPREEDVVQDDASPEVQATEPIETTPRVTDESPAVEILPPPREEEAAPVPSVSESSTETSQ